MRDRFALITQAFTELGPLTSAELARELGLERNAVADALCKMQKKRKTRPRLIHIANYVMDDEVDDALRLRAVFALGDKPDAKRPATSGAERSRRYRAKKKVKVNSIFSLALTVGERMQGKQWNAPSKRKEPHHGNEEVQG